jgi:hypothetical protein
MPYEINAECPCCGKQAHSLDELDELFGTRVMANTKKIPQSYCRACRIAHCTAGQPCKVTV